MDTSQNLFFGFKKVEDSATKRLEQEVSQKKTATNIPEYYFHRPLQEANCSKIPPKGCGWYIVGNDIDGFCDNVMYNVKNSPLTIWDCTLSRGYRNKNSALRAYFSIDISGSICLLSTFHDDGFQYDYHKELSEIGQALRIDISSIEKINDFLTCFLKLNLQTGALWCCEFICGAYIPLFTGPSGNITLVSQELVSLAEALIRCETYMQMNDLKPL